MKASDKTHTLSISDDLLCAKKIFFHLNNQNITENEIHIYKSLESTNQLAKEMATEDAKHGTIILSEEQTGGRGRLGRSFFSPKNSGIYMSIILQSTVDNEQTVSITTAASVAICRVFSKLLNIEAQIKWVNDIFINNRKVCGILTEAVYDPKTNCIKSIILGIGINVNTVGAEFPVGLKKTACSLLEVHEEKGKDNILPAMPSRNQLAASIIDEILRLNEDPEQYNYIPEYKSRCFVLGKNIIVIKGDTKYYAKAIDIDSKGGLIIKNANGSVETLNSGEITIRPQDPDWTA